MITHRRFEIAPPHPAIHLASDDLAPGSETWTALPDIGETTFSAADPRRGMDYMHARYRSPLTSRFLSTDPVGGNPKSPQSWNRYAYVHGNPLKYTDPNGQVVMSPDDVRDKIKQRNLGAQQRSLVNYAKDLAVQVKEGKVGSRDAIDKYYAKAKELTKETSNATGNALMVAVGAALDSSVHGAVSNAITRDSLGQDTLHHFFINASNTFEGILADSRGGAQGGGIGVPVWLMQAGANQLRGEDDPRDVNANNLGARYGDMLENDVDVPPSAVIPPIQ